MQIEILPTDEERLAEQALAHGYANASEFAREVLTHIASLSDEASVFAPLDADQLARSEEIISRGEADLAAGQVRDAREGLLALGAERGFKSVE